MAAEDQLFATLNTLQDSGQMTVVDDDDLASHKGSIQYVWEAIKSFFQPNVLKGIKKYRGIVIQTYPKTAAGGVALPNHTGASSTAAQQPKWVCARVRVPELHAALPDPCVVGKDYSNMQSSIRKYEQMHPWFIGEYSLDSGADQQKPKIGDVVWVSWEKGPDEGRMIGGILHGVAVRGPNHFRGRMTCKDAVMWFKGANGRTLGGLFNSGLTPLTADEIKLHFPRLASIADDMFKWADERKINTSDLVSLLKMENSKHDPKVQNRGCTEAGQKYRYMAEENKAMKDLGLNVDPLPTLGEARNSTHTFSTDVGPYTAGTTINFGSAMPGAYIEGTTGGNHGDGLYECATGIIQWMPDTAVSNGIAGTRAEAIKKLHGMTLEEQWEWAKKYLNKNTKRRDPVDASTDMLSTQELMMSVFYPAAMNQDQNEPFGKNKAENAGIEGSNPGISTPADYLNKAMGKARKTWPAALWKAKGGN